MNLKKGCFRIWVSLSLSWITFYTAHDWFIISKMELNFKNIIGCCLLITTPPLLLLILGYIIRWVYLGFKE